MLEGTIERQGFLDTIQLLSMSRKTGRLEIKGNSEGNLFFAEGQLLDCIIGALSGDEAFIELFILVSGSFKFFEEKVSVNRRINKSLTDLLMEASKYATLWDEAKTEIPYEDAALVLVPVDPRSTKMFTFDSLAWAIVSLVNGKRSFAEIARLLQHPKTKIAITVSKLKKEGIIAIEDAESALLRSVFRKTTRLLHQLMQSRVKPKVRERIFTDLNKWTFTKGFDIRILENDGVINNISYDMPIEEKRLSYRQTLEKIYEAAIAGVNRTELQDYMADLYERMDDKERTIIKESGLKKYFDSGSKGKRAAEDYWENTSGTVGFPR